jgi:hypothetical protein
VYGEGSLHDMWLWGCAHGDQIAEVLDGELHTAVGDWVEAHGGDRRRPDHIQVNEGHGRIKRRELWVAPAQELRDYLEQEFD